MNESWLPLVQAQRGRWMQIQIRLSGQPLPTPSNPFLHTSQSCLSIGADQPDIEWVVGKTWQSTEIKPSQHTMILFCRPIVIIISVYMTGLAGIASHNHPSSLIHLSPFLLLSQLPSSLHFTHTTPMGVRLSKMLPHLKRENTSLDIHNDLLWSYFFSLIHMSSFLTFKISPS